VVENQIEDSPDFILKEFIDFVLLGEVSNVFEVDSERFVVWVAIEGL
jgi:hypothetical protein